MAVTARFPRDAYLRVAAALAALAVLMTAVRAWWGAPPPMRRARDAKQCTSCSSAETSYLMDPMHNVREIVRNCALLEIHLAKERCLDCVTKHSMIVSGLIDEAICLSNDPKYSDQPYVAVLKECAADMETIEARLFSQKDTPVESAHRLRRLRKKLMPFIYAGMDVDRFMTAPAFEPEMCECAARRLPASRPVP